MLRILHDTKYDFIRHWKKAAILTIAWIIIGLGFLAVHGVNKSIEFTGGTLVQMAFKTPPQIDQICGFMKAGPLISNVSMSNTCTVRRTG